MAWARPKRTPEDGVTKARPKGMAAKRIQQATAPAPIERRNGGQIPGRVSRPVEASTAPAPVINGSLATEALFGQNPFLGVECVSGPSPAIEEVVGVEASHRSLSYSTPLAWQEEDTLLEEKSLSPIGQTSSPKAFTSPASPPTLASSHIYRQSPCPAERAEPAERPAVKEIAEIVADAEAQILRRMEGWTTEGSMLNQLAVGSMSDLRLSSAIAGDCMKLKSTVEDLKARMAHLAEENLRLRNELLLKRDDGIRTPRTPTVANLETQTMLQMMQQQLQQQQQLIQLLGTSHLAGAATPPTQVPEVAGRCFQWQPTPTPPVPGLPGVACFQPCWRPSVAPQEPVGLSQPRSCSTTPRGPLVVPVQAVERIQAPVRFQRASSVPSQRGVRSGYLPMQALQGIPMVQRAGSVTTLLRHEEPQVAVARSSSRTSEVKSSRFPAPVRLSEFLMPDSRPSLPRSSEGMSVTEGTRTTL